MSEETHVDERERDERWHEHQAQSSGSGSSPRHRDPPQGTYTTSPDPYTYPQQYLAPDVPYQGHSDESTSSLSRSPASGGGGGSDGYKEPLYPNAQSPPFQGQGQGQGQGDYGYTTSGGFLNAPSNMRQRAVGFGPNVGSGTNNNGVTTMELPSSEKVIITWSAELAMPPDPVHGVGRVLSSKRLKSLDEVDGARWSWFHAKVAAIAAVGFFTDA